MRIETLVVTSVFVSAVIVSSASATELVAYDAPFGLRFGMTPQETKLPLALPPEPPKRPSRPYNPLLPLRGMFPDGEELREQEQYKNQLIAYESLVKSCQYTFDNPSQLNFRDGGWLAACRT